jgi:dolichol-phosphate mannosyltransferase
MSRLPSVEWRMLLAPLLLAQSLLALRVFERLGRTARGGLVVARADAPGAAGSVSIAVPVLNELARLATCLDGLISQGHEVAEILVVDGGSIDGTQELVRSYTRRDPRVRLIDASPVPANWNGKAWGLQVGFESMATSVPWLLTIDADVHCAPALARSLVAHAEATGVSALSVATRQELASLGSGLIHPAFLATLVYRYGGPGQATNRVSEVQANGQCFLFRRRVLAQTDCIRVARASICEDITIARCLASAGEMVGFYEADGMVTTRMYESGAETWANWSRSLPTRDQYARSATWLGLVEVSLVQALPLPLALVLWLARARVPAWAQLPNLALAVIRLGLLFGMARAYAPRPWTYWLSPLCDLPASLRLWWSATRRQHRWRGRTLISGG